MYKDTLDPKFFVFFYSYILTPYGWSIIYWPLCGRLPFLYMNTDCHWQHLKVDSVVSAHHHWIFTRVLLSYVANIGALCRSWEMISWTLSVRRTWPTLLSRTFPMRPSSRRCCASWRVTWMTQSPTSSRWALAFSSHNRDVALRMCRQLEKDSSF